MEADEENLREEAGMTREIEQLESALRTVAADLWPHRPVQQMSFPDAVLALGILLRREASSADDPRP